MCCFIKEEQYLVRQLGFHHSEGRRWVLEVEETKSGWRNTLIRTCTTRTDNKRNKTHIKNKTVFKRHGKVRIITVPKGYDVMNVQYFIHSKIKKSAEHTNWSCEKTINVCNKATHCALQCYPRQTPVPRVCKSKAVNIISRCNKKCFKRTLTVEPNKLSHTSATPNSANWILNCKAV